MNKIRILVAQLDKIFLIDTNDIIYCKSDNSYVFIYLDNMDPILLTKSLSKFEQELPNTCFLRVSQSFVINRRQIKCIDKKKRVIELNGGFFVPYTLPLKELLLFIKSKE